MSEPHRVQRQRVKGWKMPENTISVTRPGRWGNPFKVGDDLPGMPGKKMDATDAVHCFRLFMPGLTEEAARRELRGRNLACFCALDEPCHADVLLEIANAPASKAHPFPVSHVVGQSNLKADANAAGEASYSLSSKEAK